MVKAQSIQTAIEPGLSLKASVFGFLAATTAMTVLMVVVGNLH